MDNFLHITLKNDISCATHDDITAQLIRSYAHDSTIKTQIDTFLADFNTEHSSKCSFDTIIQLLRGKYPLANDYLYLNLIGDFRDTFGLIIDCQSLQYQVQYKTLTALDSPTISGENVSFEIIANIQKLIKDVFETMTSGVFAEGEAKIPEKSQNNTDKSIHLEQESQKDKFLNPENILLLFEQEDTTIKRFFRSLSIEEKNQFLENILTQHIDAVFANRKDPKKRDSKKRFFADLLCPYVQKNTSQEYKNIFVNLCQLLHRISKGENSTFLELYYKEIGELLKSLQTPKVPDTTSQNISKPDTKNAERTQENTNQKDTPKNISQSTEVMQNREESNDTAPLIDKTESERLLADTLHKKDNTSQSEKTKSNTESQEDKTPQESEVKPIHTIETENMKERSNEEIRQQILKVFSFPKPQVSQITQKMSFGERKQLLEAIMTVYITPLYEKHPYNGRGRKASIYTFFADLLATDKIQRRRCYQNMQRILKEKAGKRFFLINYEAIKTIIEQAEDQEASTPHSSNIQEEGKEEIESKGKSDADIHKGEKEEQTKKKTIETQEGIVKKKASDTKKSPNTKSEKKMQTPKKSPSTKPSSSQKTLNSYATKDNIESLFYLSNTQITLLIQKADVGDVHTLLNTFCDNFLKISQKTKQRNPKIYGYIALKESLTETNSTLTESEINANCGSFAISILNDLKELLREYNEVNTEPIKSTGNSIADMIRGIGAKMKKENAHEIRIRNMVKHRMQEYGVTLLAPKLKQRKQSIANMHPKYKIPFIMDLFDIYNEIRQKEGMQRIPDHLNSEGKKQVVIKALSKYSQMSESLYFFLTMRNVPIYKIGTFLDQVFALCSQDTSKLNMKIEGFDKTQQ